MIHYILIKMIKLRFLREVLLEFRVMTVSILLSTDLIYNNM